MGGIWGTEDRDLVKTGFIDFQTQCSLFCFGMEHNIKELFPILIFCQISVISENIRLLEWIVKSYKHAKFLRTREKCLEKKEA